MFDVTYTFERWILKNAFSWHTSWGRFSTCLHVVHVVCILNISWMTLISVYMLYTLFAYLTSHEWHWYPLSVHHTPPENILACTCKHRSVVFVVRNRLKSWVHCLIQVPYLVQIFPCRCAPSTGTAAKLKFINLHACLHVPAYSVPYAYCDFHKYISTQ